MSTETPHPVDRVYAIGYRRLDRGGERPRSPVIPIARMLLTLAWRKRSTKFALLACAAVVFGTGLWLLVQILSRRLSSGAALDPALLVGAADEAFSAFLRTQFYLGANALAVIAGGAIAEDRRVGAMELYFSRPLTRLDYALGKFLGAFAVPFGVLVLPVFLLWLASIGVAPPEMRGGLWGLLLPALTGALLASVVLASTVLGLSAVGQRERSVAVAFMTGLILISLVGSGLASAGQPWAGYLAPERDLKTVVDWLLSVGSPSLAAQLLPQRETASNPSVLLSALALGAYASAGLAVVAGRLRQEVSG